MPLATPPNNNNDRQAVRGLTKASMNHCMQLQHLQAVPACPVALQAVSACISRMLLCVWPAAPCHLVTPRQLSLQRRRCGSARLSASSVSLQGELCCGITHSFSAAALAASSIAVKAGESMLVPLLGGGLPAGAGGGAGFFSTFRRAKYLIRCYHSK